MELSKEILSSVVIFLKYAKFLPRSKRRETWKQLVNRNREMHLKNFPDFQDEIKEAYKFVYDKKVLPSMRSMQFAGKPIKLNPARLYNCFGRETEFVTSNGVKSFDDLSNGDEVEVLTHKGNWKTARVCNYGKQRLSKIIFHRGRNKQTVRATENHRWLLRDESETTSLSVGDKIMPSPNIFGEFDYYEVDPIERLCWAYGYVFGDGTCIRDKKGDHRYSAVRLCGKDKQKYLDRFVELGFKYSAPNSFGGDVMVYTGHYLKTPPSENDSPSLIRAFVAGYLDADGNKSTDPTMISKFRGIVSTGESHQYVVEKLFPVAGVFLSSIEDISGQETNLGIRGNCKNYRLSTNLNNHTNMSFIVESIQHTQTEEDVWCLEVEDDHSFVLANGMVTGNCCFLPMNHHDAFSEVMFLLLSGCGVGYSVQQHHVIQLPEVVKPTKKRRFLVGDSIEGWSDAVKVLINAYFGTNGKKKLPEFDFSDIRAKGARLITSGGKAPGPEPLKDCLHHIQKVLDRKQDGDQLTPLEVHTINCYIADAVLSGGIRRSAMISLFSFDDEEMLTCKYGNWFESAPELARANNTAVILRHKIRKKRFLELWEKIKNSGSGEPGFMFSNDQEWGLNPCGEISLRANQFCNLVSINVSDVTDQEDLNERAKAAATIATLQATYTNFHYLRDIWQKTTERDSLIGVSMTGIASGGVLNLNLKRAAKIVQKQNQDVAKIIGISKAARCTTIKPEGTSSLVLGASSGIHAWHAPYYIRRMRLGKNEAIYPYLAENHPELVEDEYFKPTIQAVMSVPQKAPEGAITRDESAIDLLKRIKQVYTEWVKPGHRRGHNTNNVSATVTIKEDEWKKVGEWMWLNRKDYTALSILPHDGGNYIQAPFEDIDEETYNEMFEHLKEVDLSKICETEDETTRQDELACAGGSCEIT